MVSTLAYLGFLTLLGAERLVELWLSGRHARWAFAHGGVEYGARHFTWMKLLHTSFLFACATEVVLFERVFVPEVGLPALGFALAAQGLRYWAILTLGNYWNVRVIVVPGHPAVTSGPYRLLRHPNYLAVVIEGLAVPLIHGAVFTAAAFTLLNAVLLWVRIRCEEDALRRHCAYDERLGTRPSLLNTR